MEWYEAEVAQLEETARRGGIPERAAVFYGSSSVRMWDTMAEDLASDRVLNWGFGGSTLEACVHFFERLVPPLRPGSLILYAGDNDLGDGATAEQVIARFRRFQRKAARHLGGVPFAFIGIKPSPARVSILDRIVAANAGIAELMPPRSVFIDTVGAMMGPAGRPDAKYFLEDGLHLSRAGYRLWAELLRPHRKQLLIETSSERNMDAVDSIQGES